MKLVTSLLIFLSALFLASCGEEAPAGPDLSNVAVRDQNYFIEIYNRCSINNSIMDCNCVAHVNVEHRDAAYDIYAAEYETRHKPALEAEIATKAAILAEKTKNLSDERVLEALELELHDLEAKLKVGVDNIDDFELPFLPAGATDACIISN
jgi:hypothetical protein